MMKNSNCPIIAIEEHYWDRELTKHYTGLEAGRGGAMDERLYDLGALRLKEMDEAGIDVQVLSHGAPSLQRLAAPVAIPLARKANDRLHEVVRQHPDRFAAFAQLPSDDPKAAADELERTVARLGFKGAMLHGLTQKGEFLDLRRFWPIYERAAALDVPVYLHPAVPHRAVVDAYYRDYLEKFPGLLTAAWGFTVETATQDSSVTQSRARKRSAATRRVGSRA